VLPHAGVTKRCRLAILHRPCGQSRSRARLALTIG
jgi:hypothetical protein